MAMLIDRPDVHRPHLIDQAAHADVEVADRTRIYPAQGARLTGHVEGDRRSLRGLTHVDGGISQVDLSAASVLSWTEIPGVQPSLLLEEILGVSEILAENDEFVAALADRGFSIDEVLCAPLTLGNYNIPEHEGRRLIKSPCFVLGDDVSPFNRPIEGLGA
ncbi:MAG TPA: hypothetical protein EYQ80_00580, partial [Candidatus Poseidoniales archaeon]|nr:hypothetical protein [Candidatus Poseidoniales archaeon]